MAQRVVISGAYGLGNIGDEAILTVLLDWLHNNLPMVHISVLSHDPTGTTLEHQVAALHHLPLAAKWSGASHLLRSHRASLQTLQAIQASDAFVLGGGGLLHDYRGAVYQWFQEVLLARALGKHVYLFGIGVGPFHRTTARLIVKWAVLLAHGISVRDTGSYRLLTPELGLSRHVRISADLAVLLDPAPPEIGQQILESLHPVTSDARLVAFSVREWFPYVEQDPVTARLKEEQVHQKLAMVADELVSVFDATIVFLPFYRARDDIGDVLPSRDVMRRMRRQDRAYVVDRPLAPREMMSCLQFFDVMVGMRLHGLILAAAMGVPVIGIAYDPKISHFLDDLGCPDYCVTLESADIQHLVIIVKNAWADHAHLQMTVREAIENMKQRATRDLIWLTSELKCL